jgi:hypothetical protein
MLAVCGRLACTSAIPCLQGPRGVVNAQRGARHEHGISRGLIQNDSKSTASGPKVVWLQPLMKTKAKIYNENCLIWRPFPCGGLVQSQVLHLPRDGPASIGVVVVLELVTCTPKVYLQGVG